VRYCHCTVPQALIQKRIVEAHTNNDSVVYLADKDTTKTTDTSDGIIADAARDSSEANSSVAKNLDYHVEGITNPNECEVINSSTAIDPIGITNINHRIVSVLRYLMGSSDSLDIQQLKASAQIIASAAASTDALANEVSSCFTSMALLLFVPLLLLACTQLY
jgi:hypothetical protein